MPAARSCPQPRFGPHDPIRVAGRSGGPTTEGALYRACSQVSSSTRRKPGRTYTEGCLPLFCISQAIYGRAMADDDYLARIGKLIRDARQHRGWTQAQLAEALST